MSDTIKIYINPTQPVKAITVAPTGARGADGAAGTNGTNGGSTSAWQYKAKTNATSGYPGNGYLLWNNATQTSATSIIVSHLTDGDTDIELLLSFFVINQKIFIQDRDDSSKNQVWLISGTPTVTGANTSTAYYTFPVTLVSSAGAAFTNNHSILFGQISVATNAVTSATTSDGTATLSTSTLTTGTLTVSTSGVFNATSYTYGTGAASAMRTALDVLSLTSVITVTGTTPAETQPLIEQASLLNGKRWWAGGDTSVEYDGTDWLVHTFDGVDNYDAYFTSTTDKPWNINPASWNVTNGSGQPTLTIDLKTLQPIAGVNGTIAIANDQEGRVAPSDMTGLGTSVATALAINLGSSGAIVTSNSTDTLTNKTLTSPAINSATFGTAATFNSTSYTFGTGAATALNTALGTQRVMRTTLATRTSGTVLADDTLVLPVVSGVTYRVKVHSLTKNSTATVGMVLRIDHPGITASGSDSVGHLMNGGGNAAITPSSSTSLTNSVNQNGQNLSTISEVILTPSASGDVKVMWGARVPAGAETAGLNIGSYLEVTKIS